MARNFYRFYLYTLFIIIVIFLVGITAQLLITLLALTPLHGMYSSVPSQEQRVQAVIFALVGWVIAGVIGGLHYWLIRRDQRHDPAAGGSAIRAFFLNITEACGVFTVVATTSTVIYDWFAATGYDASFPAGIALPTLVMVLFLEWERRRFAARKGAALVFQRIHFFGVQFILLGVMLAVFVGNFRSLLAILFYGPQALCQGDYCAPNTVASLGLGLAWVTLWWVIYSVATYRDTSRLVRMIMHCISLIQGVALLLNGIFILLELLLTPLFKISVRGSDIVGPVAAYDFATSLVAGILVCVVYHVLLRNLSRRGLIERATRRLTEWAIASVLLMVTFCLGLGYALYNALETLAPTASTPGHSAWNMTLALLFAGLSVLPLEIILRRHVATGPRRGQVLTLFGAGLLSCVIGASVALYAWITALLGSPLTNWPQPVHAGLSAALVGALVAGFYLWTALTEQIFTRRASSSQTQTSAIPTTPALEPNIEEILDALLAGTIERAEAVRRLQAYATPTVVPLPETEKQSE